MFQARLRMKKKDRLIILNMDGSKIESAAALVDPAHKEGLLAVNVLDFVDGVMSTASEEIASQTMRELFKRIATLIQPMLETKEGLVLEHAINVKLGNIEMNGDEKKRNETYKEQDL